VSPDTPNPALTQPAPLDADLDLGEFRVASSVEIAAILRELLETQTLFTLRSELDSPLVTRLCALDLAAGNLSMELPVGGIPEGALGPEVTCEAYINHIRVQFELAKPNATGRGRDMMLVSAIPALVYRFQRRKAFRVKPHSNAPQVDLTPMDGGATVKLRILDVSMGGFALLMPPNEPGWAIGETFAVQVELDRYTHFKARMRLQNVHGSDPALGTQLGCAFTQLDREGERALQVFIDQTQKLDRLMRKA
jgi:c-di-GMP-binding flagellar brake protein YcgR